MPGRNHSGKQAPPGEVLDIARLESGNLEMSLMPVKLEGLIQDAVSMTSPLADDRSVAITWRLRDPTTSMCLPILSATEPGVAADKHGRLWTAFDRLGAEQSGVEGTDGAQAVTVLRSVDSPRG